MWVSAIIGCVWNTLPHGHVSEATRGSSGQENGNDHQQSNSPHVVARFRHAGVVGGEGLRHADAANRRQPLRGAGALAAKGAHPHGGPARCGCKCSQGSSAGRGPPTEAGSGLGTGRAQAEDGRPARRRERSERSQKRLNHRPRRACVASRTLAPDP